MKRPSATFLLLGALASSSTTWAQVAIPLFPRSHRPSSLASRSLDPTALHVVDWQQLQQVSSRVDAKFGHGHPNATSKRRMREKRKRPESILPLEAELVPREFPDDEDLDSEVIEDDYTDGLFDDDGREEQDEEDPEDQEDDQEEYDDQGEDPDEDSTSEEVMEAMEERRLRRSVHDLHRRRHPRHGHRGRSRATVRKTTSSVPSPKPTAAPKSTKGSKRAASTSKTKKKPSTKTVKTLTVATPVPLSDSVVADMDVEFYGLVSVGTPPQAFHFDMDTGSADTWVMAKSCGPVCGSHARYKPTSSSSYKDLKTAFQGTYVAGGVSGKLVSDTMALGGLVVQKQTFGAAGSVSSDWTHDPADGMFGLAFQSISTSGQAPWFTNYIQSAKLSPVQQRFSFAIGRYKSGTSKASELFIGGSNPLKYTGNFTYVPLSVQSFWQVTASSITVASSPSPVVLYTPAIFDSGTSYIVAPPAQADAFWAAVPGAAYVPGSGQYTFPCGQKVGMVVKFVGQDQGFSVNELDINLGLVAVGSNRCVGAVFRGETGGNWIFGLTFLKSYYTTFDVAGSQVGFATPAY